MTNPYEDIILLPHPVSPKRRHMTIAERAAQFAPFAALSGFSESIEEAGKEAMGEELGVMTTEDIPKFFVELGKTISDSCMDYEKYFASNCDNIRQIAQKYI